MSLFHRKKAPLWLGIIPLIIICLLLAYLYLPEVIARGRILIENPTYQPPKNFSFTLPQVVPAKTFIQPAGKSALLPGAKWVPQTFNNCAPATTSMLLQYFGHNITQEQTKAALRTSPEDTNVFTYEIRDYLKRAYDIDSKLFYNGTIDRLKLLIANGFYVLAEDWLHPNEDIGHDTILRGYDDDKSVLISDDSYIGTNITYKYELFDQTQWKPFNREYLVLYPKDKEELLKAIVGDDWDEQKMFASSIKTNTEAVNKNPQDMYSWFNLGTSYYHLKQYPQAIQAFEKSRALGWPRRMLWYQYQPIQAYNQNRQFQKALELAALGLASNDSYAELHLQSAIAHKGLGDIYAARQEVNKALFFAPNYQEAQNFADSL